MKRGTVVQISSLYDSTPPHIRVLREAKPEAQSRKPYTPDPHTHYAVQCDVITTDSRGVAYLWQRVAGHELAAFAMQRYSTISSVELWSDMEIDPAQFYVRKNVRPERIPPIIPGGQLHLAPTRRDRDVFELWQPEPNELYGLQLESGITDSAWVLTKGSKLHAVYQQHPQTAPCTSGR